MTATRQLEQPAVFAALLNVLADLYEKIRQSLTLFPKDDQPFAAFSSPDRTLEGSLLTFSGDLVDKLIYANLNARPMGFGTMRLTVWLNSSVQVPHLALEFGTVPNLFFYMDYLPRVDLWTDLNYGQQFYEAAGATHAALRNNPELAVFVSKSLIVRQLQSPAHICFLGTNTETSLELVQSRAHEMCDRWLTWLSQAEPVPEERRSTLSARDRAMRKLSAEQDPGNATVARMLGEGFTQQLVQALWQTN